MSEHPIRVGRRSRLFLRLAFGVRPGRDVVRIADGTIDIRFGWFNPRVPVTQVERWRIEGPWLWITAIGVRMSVRHHDVSFCGSPRGGVRMDFKPRYRYGPINVPAFYVGVEDLEGFAAELAALGIPGEDARTG